MTVREARLQHTPYTATPTHPLFGERPEGATGWRLVAARKEETVRMETSLVRAPGLWASDNRADLTIPFRKRGLTSVVRASGQLRITPDADLLAWLCQRWIAYPCDPAGWAGFTLRDVGFSLYGSEPGTYERRRIRDSLDRLIALVVTIEGWDSEAKAAKPTATTKAHLIDEYVSDLDRVRADSHKIGALRGETFKVRLAPWLCDHLREGHDTLLSWETLRALDGLAKRLWLYLRAERYKKEGEGHSATWIGLGAPALATLGLDGYSRHRDARAALVRAGKKICEVDPSFSSITVEGSRGAYRLVATRLDSEAIRERRRIRRIVEESLSPS